MVGAPEGLSPEEEGKYLRPMTKEEWNAEYIRPHEPQEDEG
jgi:hypothetical protein